MTLEALWYRDHLLSYLLLPLSWLYCAVVWIRRRGYRWGWFQRRRLAVPVVVVGNLTVGGTGKTPLVLWLAGVLRRQGYRPGIVTRGYRGETQRPGPRIVTAASDPVEMGDEAVLLARRGDCPVAVAGDRAAAAQMLIDLHRCDIIVADDGLQHYRLQRDLEILVVDAERGFGNGRCLPAGPLREPLRRMREVDLTVCNGAPCLAGAVVMRLVPGRLVNLRNADVRCDLADFRDREVTAVAGIGNPGRFFTLLRRHGLKVRERPYRDHHRFMPQDAAAWPAGPVLMTEKDAVKCSGFAAAGHWYLPVEADLDESLVDWLTNRLTGLSDGQEAARHPGVPPVQGPPVLRQGGTGADLPGGSSGVSDSR
jgi:tetraacyldisaccharide 4'-kinase